MFLTIFIIAVTLGTETELHLRAVNFGAAADSAFVLGNAARVPPDIPLELLTPVYLFRIQVHHIPRR